MKLDAHTRDQIHPPQGQDPAATKLDLCCQEQIHFNPELNRGKQAALGPDRPRHSPGHGTDPLCSLRQLVCLLWASTVSVLQQSIITVASSVSQTLSAKVLLSH